MILTRKIRIFPTLKQEEILLSLSEKCRLIYNFALAERIENWKRERKKSEHDRKYISYIQQQNALPIIKAKYPEYKWVYSKVLQGTLRKLDESYKSFFMLLKNGHKEVKTPRFRGRHHFMVLCYNQSGFKFDWQHKTIQFSHKHPLSIELKFALPWLPEDINEDTKVKQVEIVRDNKKSFFICVQFLFHEPTYIDNGLYQAIDLGIINLVTAVNIHCKFISRSTIKQEENIISQQD